MIHVTSHAFMPPYLHHSDRFAGVATCGDAFIILLRLHKGIAIIGEGEIVKLTDEISVTSADVACALIEKEVLWRHTVACHRLPIRMPHLMHRHAGYQKLLHGARQKFIHSVMSGYLLQ